MDISAGTGVPVFATTVTRDAAFGGANKVLAEGQTCYLESTNVVQYYDGAAWATVGPSSAGGLVPITPSSIAVGSGTATSAGNGQVTFTTVGTNLSLNGVFSSSYTNYRIMFSKNSASGTARQTMRFRSGSTDNTNANYDTPIFGVNQASAVFLQSVNNNSSLYIDPDVGSPTLDYFSIDIFAPNVSGKTGLTIVAYSGDGTTHKGFAGSATLFETYVADGITFIVDGGGTMTGTVSVYGYAI